jgi:two-component system, cell cycle sensor histidine kinase PleC
MALAAKPAMPDLREGAPLLDGQEAQAVIAIDAEAAEILSANASGAVALGLFPYASFPIALDPAMPAVARLRQIAAMGGTDKTDPETLLFWKSGQLRRVRCRVAKQGKSGSKVLLLHVVEVETPPDAGAPQPLISSAASTFASGGMEVLREIAEQLRQARALGGSQQAAPSAADVPAPKPLPLPVLDADSLAKLAHELKTPLTAIAAASEIMRDERLGEMKNERYLSYAADIHESATHALDVIASLLSDRAKSSAPVSRLIALDLNALVERTASSVQALAESCGLTLSFESDGSHPRVVANPTALRQVLLNLLTNAIKFTPRGGDVRVATGHMGDGRVFLVVRDTGCGMSGTSSLAFEAASAADSQPKWARSNGIGLPLVEKLVRDMGAEIEIESVPQKGTAATIVFNDFAR